MAIVIGSIITSKDDPLNNIGIVEEIKTNKVGNIEETVITARQRGYLIARNSRNVIDLTDKLKGIVENINK